MSVVGKPTHYPDKKEEIKDSESANANYLNKLKNKFLTGMSGVVK